MRLIVNSDDFGISKGVTLGIIEAYKNGVVRSATLMANMKDAEYAANLSKNLDGLGVGIHLTLTAGYPISKDVYSLVDKEGKFLKIDRIDENIKVEDIRKEFKCQMERFLSFGIKPTHIDTHHHVHRNPKVLEVVKELAIEYNIPLRLVEETNTKLSKEIKKVDKFIDNFHRMPSITEEGFISILENNKEVDLLEIMCHPGYLDQYIYENSSYSIPRMREVETLTSRKVLNYIKENNIELVNYLSL